MKENDQKKQMGVEWEDWQNFFWQKRLTQENADPGFELFLKWGTIILICTQAVELRYRYKDEVRKIRQSTIEAKENYIGQMDNDEYQQEILVDFQINHTDFDIT